MFIGEKHCSCMGAPLVGVAPIFALSFMGFGLGKKIQQVRKCMSLKFPQNYLNVMVQSKLKKTGADNLKSKQMVEFDP